MLRLKEANWEDAEKEHAFIAALPRDENGFTNQDYGVGWEEFQASVLPRYIRHAKGVGLPPGYVPCTAYFLWDGGEIVGLFRLRHCLNDALREGAGHIGYSIKKGCRGRGYATQGLAMVLRKAWGIVPEDEVYLSVHKGNPASLRVQLKNGAYIHHEGETEFYTRVKRPASPPKDPYASAVFCGRM